MPYIKDIDGRRYELRNGSPATNAGELNYQIFSYLKYCSGKYSTIKIIRYVEEFLGCKPNYQRYNNMVGALTCCYKELIRREIRKVEYRVLLDIIDGYEREIAIYENLKISENGDV